MNKSKIRIFYRRNAVSFYNPDKINLRDVLIYIRIYKDIYKEYYF